MWPGESATLVPGKRVFSEVVGKIKDVSGVTVTRFKVADALSTAAPRPGLTALLDALDAFRRMPPP